MEAFGHEPTRTPTRLIFVVDDDPVFSEVIAYFLQSEGYEVEYAISGEMALRRLADVSAALLLTGYMMPGMDGCELISAMREIEKLAATPVLMASELSEDIVRKKCAFHAFIRKPFIADELLNSVRTLLGKG